MRKERSVLRITSLFHLNINEFVERTYRSTNALTQSMMAGTGLPNPYLEKASRYASLIAVLCIIK